MMPAESAFTELQYAANYPTRPERHFWHQTREKIVFAEIQKRGWDTDGLVLDVGCGPGLMVRALRARGIEGLGCDLARIPNADGKTLISQTKAQDLPRALREQVRVLLYLDVLEHLGNPQIELGALRTSFPRAQGLIVTVPARRELWTNYDEYFGHHRRYDRDALRNLLKSAAGEILRCDYFFHALYAPIFALARTQRPRRIEMHSRLPQWAHLVMAELFTWESRILPGALPGSSLIATVRF